MSRLSTIAGAFGIVVGVSAVISILASAPGCIGGACPYYATRILEIAAITLGVALILASSFSFFWRRSVLYGSSLLSATVAAAVAAHAIEAGKLQAISIGVSLALSLMSALANLVAAKTKDTVPEESHPLNLPVFG